MNRLLILLCCLLLVVACNNNDKTLRPQGKVDGVEQKEQDVVFGDDSAKNTIIMYASYGCVYCRYFFTKTYPELKENYLDNGNLKLVVKWLDFGEQPQMLNALQAASCISRYGVYNKFHELLIVNPSVIFTPEFDELLADIMAHNSLIAECVLQNDNYSYLRANVDEFKANNISGTPAFIMNKNVYTGFRSYEDFERLIEKEFKF